MARYVGISRFVLPFALACAAALPACSGARAGGGTEAVAKGGVVRLQVTDRGFEPGRVKVKRGEPLKLLVTRKTDETCAKELVLDEYGIHVKLPLNEEVAIAFTPTKSGELTYGCAMNKMISGVLAVE
jgi:plastocyanin domain-containing protein